MHLWPNLNEFPTPWLLPIPTFSSASEELRKRSVFISERDYNSMTSSIVTGHRRKHISSLVLYVLKSHAKISTKSEVLLPVWMPPLLQ